MLASMTSWVVIIFTTLGAGATGALITTYGTQTRERRAARAQARESLRRAEQASTRAAVTPHPVLIAALDDLDTRAMLAGLPSRLVELHREASLQFWARATSLPDHGIGDPETLASGRIARRCAELLAAATWHPWRSALRIAWRTRRLRKILDAGMPARASLLREARLGLRGWEKDLLKQRWRTAHAETGKTETDTEG
jgi:hypothetical protein